MKQLRIFLLILASVLTMAQLSGCDIVQSEPMPCDHDWEAATCKSPKTCKYCGITVGGKDPENHNWSAGTCTSAPMCSRCGATDGEPAGHQFTIEATCTTAKKCSRCDATEGEPLGHDWKDFICTRCGKNEPLSTTDIPNILDITALKYKINSYGDVYIYMDFVNKSESKTIDTILFSLSFYDSNGNIIHNRIKGNGTDTATAFSYTERLGPKKKYRYSTSSHEYYWDTGFYCSDFKYLQFNEIGIHYTDGTALTFDYPITNAAVVRWR